MSATKVYWWHPSEEDLSIPAPKRKHSEKELQQLQKRSLPPKGVWSLVPYMEKEHSVLCNEGRWLATVVFAPKPKKKEDDKETNDEMDFVKVGIRIEYIKSRKRIVGENGTVFVLSGQTLFVKTVGKPKKEDEKPKPLMVSEKRPYDFAQNRLGYAWNVITRKPEVSKPMDISTKANLVGIPLEKHPLKALIEKAVRLAEESHAAYVQAKRAAA